MTQALTLTKSTERTVFRSSPCPAKEANFTDERKDEIFKNAKKATKRDEEIGQERANEVIAKYINEILSSPQKLIKFNLDGIVEVFNSLDNLQKNI